jgi:hypothetical protein
VAKKKKRRRVKKSRKKTRRVKKGSKKGYRYNVCWLRDRISKIYSREN